MVNGQAHEVSLHETMSPFHLVISNSIQSNNVNVARGGRGEIPHSKISEKNEKIALKICVRKKCDIQCECNFFHSLLLNF